MLDRFDAYGAAAAVRAGEVSPTELVTASLAAIEQLDGQLGACPVVLGEAAERSARAAEAALARGESRPLLGVPITIKDHIWLSGAPATNGSVAYENFVPTEDCVAVARLRAAGAVVVAKTNNPEFCYRGFTDNAVFGLTRNPWRLDRTPGGSSGGAAASVAAGMAPIGLGTDGGGSVRIPAAFCGVAGHKPTFGLVPKEPGFKGWKTLSVDGPIARSVRDLALALHVLAGPSTADDLSYPAPPADYLRAATEPRDLSGLRVAYSADLGCLPVEPAVRAAFTAAVERFAAGTGCQPVPAAPDTAAPMRLWQTIAGAEGWASEGPLLAEWEQHLSEGTAEIIRSGKHTTAGEYVDAQHERAAYTRKWAEFLTAYDLLLLPAVPVPPFPVGVLEPLEIDGVPLEPGFDDWCGLLLPANLTGQPATNVPIGFDAAGLPLGMQFMAARFADDLTLAAAAAWERLAPWTQHWPPVSVAGL